jgi:coniferyl-aldehyde dehydrogenase
MNAPAFPPDLAIRAEFQTCFAAQRVAYLKAPQPPHEERVADLKALGRLIKDN